MKRSRVAIPLLLVFLSRVWNLAALTAADAPILVSDDFSTLNPAWGQADDNLRVSDGKLIIQPSANAAYRVFYGKEPLGDVDVRVQASLTKGGVDRAGGIIFWGSDDGFYAARFYTDGYVGIARYTQRTWLAPVPNYLRQEVTQGLGVVNELRVVTSGNQATVYVNGKEVATLKGFPPEGGGKVGLFGDSTTDPYEWAFSDFSVRKGPAPQAATKQDDGLLFADDFAALDPAWGAADKVQSVNDHKLVMTPVANTIRTTLYAGSLFAEADIRVQVSLAQGGSDSAAGVVFWAADGKNYYVARVYSDGFCGVARSSDGKLEAVVPSKEHRAVRKGVGQTNELRVVMKGESATFYVNSVKVAALKGTPPSGGGRIGLQAGSPQDLYTWTFANLTVRKVSEPVNTPPDPKAIFTDDFSTLSLPADETLSVSDNRLLTYAKPQLGKMLLYDKKFLSAIDVRVKVQQINGGDQAGAGITFWAEDLQQFYLFQVYTDGSADIARRYKNRTLFPVKLTRHPAIKKGAGEVNELRVVTSGNLATCYVNGEQIFEIKGHPPGVESKMGVRGASGDGSYLWAFSDLRVYPGPAPKPPAPKADPALLYEDDFSTLDPSWGSSSDMQYVNDGKLVYSPTKDNIANSLFHGDLFDEVDLRVKVAQTKGNPKNHAGVVFWSDGKNFYTFLIIAENGSFLIARYLDGKFSGTHSVIVVGSSNKGLGQTNELRVVTEGKTAKLYCNDKLITTYKGEPPEGGSQVGLIGDSPADEACTYEFSKFIIRKPAPE